MKRQAVLNRNCRLLLVEDDPFILHDLAQQLSDEGFLIAGEAGTASEALSLLEREGCDVAVLDVNLGKETSEAVAVALTQRGIPFVTVSAYAKDQHPEIFDGAPLLAKPLRMTSLIDILAKLCG